MSYSYKHAPSCSRAVWEVQPSVMHPGVTAKCMLGKERLEAAALLRGTLQITFCKSQVIVNEVGALVQMPPSSSLLSQRTEYI